MYLTPTPTIKPTASGLIAGGNFIVDTVILIDRFPQQDMLANIIDETPTNGGGPYNVLRDLSAMQVPFPLSAVGLVGEDDKGQWVAENCQAHQIGTDQLRTTSKGPTSHTHVMTAADTGRRTFFHHRGANSLLAPHHFNFKDTSAKLFYLGYLMLLDSLDDLDDSGRTGASRVLETAKGAGLVTIADLVSVEHSEFRARVTASLPWIDHLILNEVEASRLVGRELKGEDHRDLENAAQEILAMGIGVAVVLHSSSGGIVASHSDGLHTQAALVMPPEKIRGSNGAGDAFAAGYIFGLHEDWSIDRRLQLAVSAAAISLTDPSPSAGLLPCAEIFEATRHLNRTIWVQSEPQTTTT